MSRKFPSLEESLARDNTLQGIKKELKERHNGFGLGTAYHNLAVSQDRMKPAIYWLRKTFLSHIPGDRRDEYMCHILSIEEGISYIMETLEILQTIFPKDKKYVPRRWVEYWRTPDEIYKEQEEVHKRWAQAVSKNLKGE